MSAILPGAPFQDIINGSLGEDGIRRYKTRCKILVDSHNAGTGASAGETLAIVEDVVAVDMNKSLKGAGQATVTLIPSKNYMNLIFPNDYINIYFDIGDGSGWTRTFFGFVDRVEESYSVTGSGQPNTQYRLVCTDFYKVFDRTRVYFNPQLANREDWKNYDFADYNIGGMSLMTKGIVAGGSPPDVIVNLVLLLLGFGTQFRLPPSYQPSDTQARLRRQRAELVQGRLIDEEGQKLLGDTYQKLRTEVESDVSGALNKYNAGVADDESKRLEQLAKAAGLEGDLATLLADPASHTANTQLLADQWIREKLEAALDQNQRNLTGGLDSLTEANFNLLQSTVTDKAYLSDILDVFTFVERRSIDGFFFGAPVWQRQGSLLQIMRAFSHEALNELFFDLRPLSAAAGDRSQLSDDVVEGIYARVRDDKGGNIDTTGNAPIGITYIPSIVMREYPFATIQGLYFGPNEVELQLLNPEDKPEFLPPLFFGAIFSNRPGDAGRHIIEHDNINVSDRADGNTTTKGKKHLDVAVVSEKEIQKTVLGRSDNDHFNLWEFYSDDVLGSNARFFLKDVIPVITPIHIVRNGLRVNTTTTRAARFTLASIRNLKPPKDVAEVLPAGSTEVEEPTELPEVSEIQAPFVSGDSTAEGLVIDDEIVFYNNNADQANWGYRAKPRPGGTEGPDAWVFHQGIDILRRPLSDIPLPKRFNPDTGKPYLIPIRAVADGWLVVSAPDGCYNGYGNVVVMKHRFEGIGIRYSVYSHLSQRLVGWDIGLPGGNARNRKFFCAADEAPGVSKAQQKVKFIPRGTVIGYMGNTGFTSSTFGRFHLHFEICRDWPPRNDSVTQRIPFTTVPQSGPTPQVGDVLPDFDQTGTSTELMAAAGQNSCDPVRFFQTGFGIDLVDQINGTGGDETGTIEGEPDETDIGGNTPEEILNRPRSDVQEETGTDLTETKPLTGDTVDAAVDSSTSRIQIIRWALLQDHWYQHNLEYLSGTVQMRGAPEIRVGYRLDVKERNMSFYVEGVNHSWRFPNNMVSTLQVTRGQPNNPYPVYVYPNYKAMGTPDDQRKSTKSRLANFFVTPDPVAIRRSLFLRSGQSIDAGGIRSTPGSAAGDTEINYTDNIEAIQYDTETRQSAFYANEKMIPADPGGTAEFAQRAPEGEGAVTEGTDPVTPKASETEIAGTDARGTQGQGRS